jgi:hypothetical protein
MGNYLQILVFVTMGVVLLWFGYTLLIGQLAGIGFLWRTRPRRAKRRLRGGAGNPGDPQVCPVCSARLNKGELVSSAAFPSLNGGKDRLMHIRGCVCCIEGSRPRTCPVCGAVLGSRDILVARMFDRPRCRSHVHVLGCNRCKKTVRLH